MEDILLETLGLTRDEFEKGLMDFYQKKGLEELNNLERLKKMIGKNYLVGESKTSQWYEEYIKDLIDKFLKKELEFCKEIDFEKNEHDQFIYESKNGKSIINLPYILQEYKQWLIQKEIVKEI